ncbi:hypothetical protein AsAng_0028970 [Aureispira anguillae]|uniref:Uncharacterized protein n=1 Tax=Aureispira anguillae TaxID=2864201 RepID=A0A915YFH4_9BACT|nr:hypothetical protein AsAng_0028970 [Aureispira anguillae]
MKLFKNGIALKMSTPRRSSKANFFYNQDKNLPHSLSYGANF